MIDRETLEKIENLMNQAGQPVYCLESLEQFTDQETQGAKLVMVFQEGKEEDLFKSLNKYQKEISVILLGEKFFIKPITSHYFIIKHILLKVCPDYRPYYFSAQKGEKILRNESGQKFLDINLKLILIKKGNVEDVTKLEDLLCENVRNFNAQSKFIKIKKIELADKDSPFSFEGDTVVYRDLGL